MKRAEKRYFYLFTARHAPSLGWSIGQGPPGDSSQIAFKMIVRPTLLQLLLFVLQFISSDNRTFLQFLGEHGGGPRNSYIRSDHLFFYCSRRWIHLFTFNLHFNCSFHSFSFYPFPRSTPSLMAITIFKWWLIILYNFNDSHSRDRHANDRAGKVNPPFKIRPLLVSGQFTTHNIPVSWKACHFLSQLLQPRLGWYLIRYTLITPSFFFTL